MLRNLQMASTMEHSYAISMFNVCVCVCVCMCACVCIHACVHVWIDGYGWIDGEFGCPKLQKFE